MVDSKTQGDHRPIEAHVVGQHVCKRPIAIEATMLDPGEIIADEPVSNVWEIRETERDEQDDYSNEQGNRSHEVGPILVHVAPLTRSSWAVR